MLETLTTLTNIPEYKSWLSASYFAIYKGMQENLIAKLFSVFAYDYILYNQKLVKNVILKGIRIINFNHYDIS